MEYVQYIAKCSIGIISQISAVWTQLFDSLVKKKKNPSAEERKKKRNKRTPTF